MNTFADKKTTQVKSATPAKAPTQASMSGFSTARSMGGGQNIQGAPMQIRPMSPGTVPAQGKSAEEKREGQAVKKSQKAKDRLDAARQRGNIGGERYEFSEAQRKRANIAQERYEFSEFVKMTDYRRTGTRTAKKDEARAEFKEIYPGKLESAEDRLAGKRAERRAGRRTERRTRQADKKSQKYDASLAAERKMENVGWERYKVSEFVKMTDYRRTGTRRAKKAEALSEYAWVNPSYELNKSATEKRAKKANARLATARKRVNIAQERYEFSEFVKMTDDRRTGTRTAKKDEARAEFKEMYPGKLESAEERLADKRAERRAARRRQQADKKSQKANARLAAKQKRANIGWEWDEASGFGLD